jgi:hypothetical protein
LGRGGHRFTLHGNIHLKRGIKEISKAAWGLKEQIFEVLCTAMVIGFARMTGLYTAKLWDLNCNGIEARKQGLKGATHQPLSTETRILAKPTPHRLCLSLH